MRIAFCACSKTHKEPEHHAWSDISRQEPDLLLLLGDLVYAPNRKWQWRESRRARMFARFRERYREHFARADFRELLDKVKHAAIWDDHDFAWNDCCGAKMPADIKANARALLDEFLGDRIGRTPERIYHSFELESDSVKVIMLDCRSFRTRAKKKGTMLGKQQLEWLLQELDHQSEITIVANGSCLTRGLSGWDRFDREFAQVTRAFAERGKILYLGGDIHKNTFESGEGFHEAISSGVGRKDRGNFGLVDIDAKVLTVQFIGRRERDRSTHRIDRKTWRAC
ncbi:MAG: alkaline phosphatase D [Planctomycetota bacterium]|jgi:alkaline phosphatase D